MNTLAKDAVKKITSNKFLLKKYDIFSHYNNLTKEIITKCLTEINNTPLTYFSQYSKEIENDYNNLKIDYNNIFTKFNALLDECRSDISMGKPILVEKKKEEFFLDNIKIEKEDTINSLKKSIKSSKEYHLFREPKRDNLIDIKKGTEEMERITNDLQQNMLYECKQCNKYTNKIIKYKSKIIGIEKNIELLKKYIDENKYKLSYKQFSRKNTKNELNGNPNKNKQNILNSERISNTSNFINKYKEDEFENNSDDDKGNKKPRNQNKLFKDFIKIENLFDILNEEGKNEEIIDNELHSDDDSVFENKIKSKNQLSTKHLEEIKKSIHSLNLKQIIFNSSKVNEIDIYSLQRRKFKNKTIDKKIKEMKKKIDKSNNKLTLLKEKENIMRDFVKKLEENYEIIQPMIYQVSEANIKPSTFIVDSLNGKNIFDREDEEDDKFDDNFLDNIEEVDEYEYNENEQNEKSDNDKKETKEIKETRKDDIDEEEKKMELKILKSVLKKKAKLQKTIKHKSKKHLISITGSSFKKQRGKNIKRSNSK